MHEVSRERESEFSQIAISSREVQHSFEQSILIALSGSEKAIKYSVAPIIGGDQQILGTVLVFHDITSSRQLTQELKWFASHDPLTRLANRREFERQLQLAIDDQRNAAKSHILLFMDLDLSLIHI